MSSFNRNDFDFDDDDDFQFDDDDGFSFDDDGGGNDFDFGDDEPANVLDDDGNDFDFDGDSPAFDDDDGDGGGTGGVNRTFIILAGVMILLFVVGLVVVLIIATQPQAPTPNQLTATAIVATNQAVEIALNATQTQSVIDGATGTAQALLPTNTPTLEPTFTPTREPTFTPTPTDDPTQAAANALLTQQALSLTQTAQFLLTPPTQPAIDQNAVALTATALAGFLAPPTDDGQGGGVPTQEVFPTASGGGGIPTQLPDTGLFDDLTASGASTSMLLLMSIGLVGVILVSRRLRASSSKR